MGIEYITKYNAPAMMAGRQGHDVTGIVVHHYGSDLTTFSSAISTLTRVTASTSAHFVVDTNVIAQLVALSDTAYHAGDWNANLKTIGIECPPLCTKAQQDTLIELLARLYKHYGRVLPLSGHRDYCATACPGRWYPLLSELQERATARYHQLTAPTPTQEPTPSDWAQDACKWAAKTGLIVNNDWATPVTMERLAVILQRFDKIRR